MSFIEWMFIVLIMCLAYRLAYLVWLIDQLIDRHSPECDKPFEVYVMYDIACTLQKNLEVRILSMYIHWYLLTICV